MTDDSFRDRIKTVAPGLLRLSEPKPLFGPDYDLVRRHYNLNLTEYGAALGVNTASLYGKKADPKKIGSSLSILLRLYGAFPELIPRIEAPTPAELFSEIHEIDPEFRQYFIGPLLGLETNSAYRINTGTDDFDASTPTVRALAALIYKLVKSDPAHLELVKQAVELEAAASGIQPPTVVWRKGGWKKKQRELQQKQEESGLDS